MLVGALAERQALVHADDLDAEAARLLDEADAGVVGQEEAVAVRAPLRIGLPGADAELLGEPRHVLDVPGLVRVHAAVDQQAVIAFHAVHDLPHRVRGLDLERRGVASRRHERQHHHVRVAVEEHVLHEFVCAQAGEVAARAVAVVERATRLGGEAEGIRRCGLEPGLGGIDVVALHVEDEFAALEARRGGGFERGGRGQVEEAAGAAGRGVRGVEGEQRGGRSAGRDQEIAPPEAQAPRMDVGRGLGQVVRVSIRAVERHRLELAVAGRIELDRQAPAFRIDGVHRGILAWPSGDGWAPV